MPRVIPRFTCFRTSSVSWLVIVQDIPSGTSAILNGVADGSLQIASRTAVLKDVRNFHACEYSSIPKPLREAIQLYCSSIQNLKGFPVYKQTVLRLPDLG